MCAANSRAVVELPADIDLPRHLARCLKRRWRRYRKAIKRCRRKGNEPAVHQARVQTRQLLASLELLQALLPPKYLKRAWRRLKRHLRAFADLRDTQVQLALSRQLVSRLPQAAPLEAILAQRERRGRKQTRRRIDRFKNEALADLIQAVHRQVRRLDDRTARTATLSAVGRAFSQAVRRREQIRPEDTRSFHRARVAFKHFRYMAESLQGAVRGVNRALSRRLQAYQMLLGQIQDREVFDAFLQSLAKDGDLSPEAVSVCRAELQRQKRRLINRFLKRADALRGFWPPPAPAARTRRSSVPKKRLP